MSGLERFQDPMTPADLAKHWRLSDETIRAMCRDGKIPGAFPVGTQWRIPKSAVLAYEKSMADAVASGNL